MIITDKMITKGFIAAGLMNASVLIFSKLFTNEVINQTDPNVMSNFGLVMILMWGLAYISVARTFEKVNWLVAVFAIEKLIYAIVWVNWILNNSVAMVYEQDTFSGIFYSIYRINDGLFCLLFVIVFFRNFNRNKSSLL